MFDKTFPSPKKQNLKNRLFNSHESLLSSYTSRNSHANKQRLNFQNIYENNDVSLPHRLKLHSKMTSVSLNDVRNPLEKGFSFSRFSKDRLREIKTVSPPENFEKLISKKDKQSYQLTKSLSLPLSLRNFSSECIDQLTSNKFDYSRNEKSIEKEYSRNNRVIENPIMDENLSLTSKTVNPIYRHILKNQHYNLKKASNPQEFHEFSYPSERRSTKHSLESSKVKTPLRSRSNSTPCDPLSTHREQLVIGKDGLCSDKNTDKSSQRSLHFQKRKLLKSFSYTEQKEDNPYQPFLRRQLSYQQDTTKKQDTPKQNNSKETGHENSGNMRTRDEPFLFLQPSRNETLLLSLDAASFSKKRRASIDYGEFKNLSSSSYDPTVDDLHYSVQKENDSNSMASSQCSLLERNPFQLRTRKSSILPHTKEAETYTAPLKGILKDTDRAFFYGDKTSPKSIPRRNDLTISPTLSHRSPPEGESAGSDMLILEQDLSDDINLYRENLVIKEFESRKIKTLLRCDSAPDKLYKDRLMQIEKDRNEKERRRNSSIECRTNRVRFKLEESFKEEEERYLQLSEAENDHATKYEDVEVFKTTVKPVTVNSVETVDPITEVKAPSVISPRQRKVSVFTYSEAVPIKLESNETKVEPCIESVDTLKVDTVSYGRKMSIKEETIPVKTVSSKRKKSLLTPLTKIMNSDKGSQSSLDSLNKEKKSKQKLSVQEDSKKQRKKSKQESSPVPQRRKSSVTERKVSITDTIRSVVGNKKKKSATENPDLNNNKKSSAWNAIKGKMKIEKRNSTNGSPTQSPRNFRFFRNDSTSSIGSSGRFKRGSLSRQNSDRSLSDSFERKSTLSLSSEAENEDICRTTVPYDKFKLWSGGNPSKDNTSDTLPLLHVACSDGNVDLLKTLVDCGVDINEPDSNGWPALHYAICNGHFNCAEVLISNGCRLKQYSNRVMNTYCSEIRKAMNFK